MADTKRCCRCNETKPRSAFTKRKEMRDGLRSYCKACDAKAHAKMRDSDRDGFNAKRRDYYKENPAPARQQAMRWAKENPDRVRENMHIWIENNREKMTNYYRKSWLKKYRLTPEKFEAMYEAQNGVCAICEKPANENLCVDHCHDTGIVRGLLCRKCNSGIGMLNDDAATTIKAVEYLIPTNLSELVDAARSF